jgi:hypothetical protein
MMELSRQQLYDLVWSKPIRDIAEDFGYSDKGMAKICNRYNVPRPQQGYWNRIKAGHKQEVTPLPHEENDRKIIFPKKIEKPKNAIGETVVVHVQARLTDPHPLVVEAKKYFSLPSKEKNWELGRKVLSIRATDVVIPRALRIFDAAIKELERRGAKVSVRDGKTVAKVGEIEIAFHIEEPSRLEIVEDPVRKAKESFYSPKRLYHATGKLSLIIDSRGDSVRSLFRDGRRQTVEGALGEFIVAVFEMALVKKKWEDHWEEQRKLSRERERLFEIEKARRKLLSGEIERHQSISKITSYLLDLEEGRTPTIGEGEKWIVWVRRYLARLKEPAPDESLLRLAELAQQID